MKKRSPFSFHTLAAEVRRRLLNKDTDHWCSSCGQRVMLKPHILNNTMVNFLVRLAQADLKYKGGWYRTADIVPRTGIKHTKRSSDGPSLRHWGLILAADDSVNAAGAPVGSYQITTKGYAFLRGDVTVPERIYVYNGELVTTGSEHVNVHEANKKHFDFNRDVLEAMRS